VHATLGSTRERPREVALQIAEVARAYGYGFPSGDAADPEALRKAGLFERSDAASYQAWWDDRESRQSAVE
jgi:hypothetical protein